MMNLLMALLLGFTVSFTLLAYSTIKANRMRRRHMRILKEIQDELKRTDPYRVDESAGNG